MPKKISLRLFDTMSKQEEEILPSDGKTIRMYTCGPTVYDVAHIGNFRTFIFEDLIRRTLKLFGYPICQVMNITDVDDKTIRGAMQKGVSLEAFTDTFKKAFFEDLKTLRIERAEHYPEATKHIKGMIDMIATLVERGAAYQHSDGSVYFSIDKARGYGKLSHLKIEELRSNTSVKNFGDEYSHEGIADFALWKAYDKERDGNVYWESPWGKGRPGWHLECSIMAREFLGETIDLHAGGVDLIFPHHENEIAQSETASGRPFALHWAHGEHLLVDHKKMSKKLGNFYTLRDLLDKGYAPSAIRFFLISNHYRTQLNFTFQGLDAALSSIKRIRDFAERLSLPVEEEGKNPEYHTAIDEYEKRFFDALSRDLNISEALAAFFDSIRYTNHLLDTEDLGKKEIDRMKMFLLNVDKILDILTPDETSLPEKIALLVKERKQAREEKKWQRSDAIRDELNHLGYIVEDLPTGQRVTKSTPTIS